MATKKKNNKKKKYYKSNNSNKAKNNVSTTKKVTSNNSKTKNTNKQINKTNKPSSTSNKKISTTKNEQVIKENIKSQQKKNVNINLIEKEEKESKPLLNIEKQKKSYIKNLLNKICKHSKKDAKSIKKIKNTNYNKSIIEEDIIIEKVNYKEYKGLAKIKAFFSYKHKVRKYDMKRFKKRFKYGTLKDKILIIVMLGLIALVSMFIAFCIYIVATAPDITEERLYKENSTVIYDKDGNEIARLGTENREKVTYDELPEVLIDAIIATEDSRFFQHSGVDIARFTKAVIGQLFGQDAGGASTLTMQISKNTATNDESSGIKGIIRKFQDVYLSVFVFEKKFTKEQIIEFYVNIQNLGAGTYGVQQASKVYFGKNVSQLTLTEAALIAGLFQAPSKYNPYNYPENAAARRKTVLNLMYRHGYITKEEMEAANSVDVESLLVGKDNSLNKYQGFIDTVIEEVKTRTGNDPARVSMKIWSTMDADAQDVINAIYDGETYTWKNEYAQAGIAVTDVKTGAISAVGAGRNKTSELSFNYATSASRHPGSSAKPILDYGPAIEYLGWSTGQTIIDEEMTYTNGASIKNWDNGYKGIMTIKTALASSRNIPALFTFQQTTNEQKATFAKALGWKPEDDGAGVILESCSIGGFNGVTPLESSAAYGAFARGGEYIEPYSFTKIEYTETGDIYEVNPERHTVMGEDTAYLINMILKYAVTSGNVAPGTVSGTDVAAKTGTSTIDEAKRKALGLSSTVIGDAWIVAYSPDYSISLWYGYEKIDKDHYLTNNEGGTARKAIMKQLTSGIMKKNSRFTKPSSVVTAEIELETDPLELASPYTPKELRSTEYFKKGTVPTNVSQRFAQLSNISNLTYTSTSNTVTVSWNAASTPDAINEEYLKNYFENSTVYKKWSDKYLQKRLDYNTNTFGQFGYRVYLQTDSGTKELGFTTSTTFTTNITDFTNAKIIVKTSYQKFTSNASTGVSIDVTSNYVPSTPNEEPEKPVEENKPVTFTIDYIGPSCSTVKDFNNLGSNDSNKLKVIATIDGNKIDVTSSSKITCIYYDENDNVVNSLTEGKSYDIICSVTYSGKTQNKNISLKSSC